MIQLGDIIDGKCKFNESQESALNTVLDVFKKSKCTEIYHVIGNHELYCFDRQTLQ